MLMGRLHKGLLQCLCHTYALGAANWHDSSSLDWCLYFILHAVHEVVVRQVLVAVEGCDFFALTPCTIRSSVTQLRMYCAVPVPFLRSQLPDGAWFCSPECTSVKDLLKAWVAAGDVPLTQSHSWQLLNGKDGSISTGKTLRVALDLLQSSFDPIMDANNETDLLPKIVYATVRGNDLA